MRRKIALVLAALVVAATGFASMHSNSASATAVEPSAAYYPVDSYGELEISGESGAEYAVWGEDASGGYAVIGYGHLDSAGSAFLWVAEEGAANDAPQFVIEVGGGGGGFLAVSDPAHEWWLD